MLSTPMARRACTSASALLLSLICAAASAAAPAASAAAPAAAPAAPAATGAAAADAAGSWDLTDLYASDADWDESLRRARERTDELARYRGTLGASAPSMLAALIAISDAKRDADRLFAYASLESDEDLRISANLERKQKASNLRTQLAEKTAWFAPEILDIGAAKVRLFRSQDRTLDERFGFLLADTLRAGPHTLGPQAEDVLAATGSVLAQPDNIRGILADAEFPSPVIALGDGTRVRLDEAAYVKYRAAPGRADRKAVFDAYWGTWKKFEGTAGAVLATDIMGDHLIAHARKFSGDLAAAQFQDNMPEAVYRTLISETNAALPTLHRYLRLRKRLLGIGDELRYYDSYPPLVTSAHAPEFSVEESKRLTLLALEPLGEDYLGLLRKGFDARWMSVYPHAGKASGAYMNPAAYDVHPYLLLNHNGDYLSLSTLAHEWGHAVHTLLADRAQPFDKSSYSTFIAESASIGNEMLLNDYLIAHARDRDERLFYVGQGLESIRTSFFRQAMFAEFEYALHQEIEQGRALSGQHMTDMYCGLLRKYYGEAEGVMKIDPQYCVEWAFIPHFYYDFYVYQYSTSMAGAAFFTDAILKEGAPARERFLALLRAGGSDYPYDLYKRAGVDMATPGPYRALIARMNRLLDEFETPPAEKPRSAKPRTAGF